MRLSLILLIVSLLLSSCNSFTENPIPTEVRATLISQTPPVSQMEPVASFSALASKEPYPEQTATTIHAETSQPTQNEMRKVLPEQINQKSLCPANDFVLTQNLGIPPYLGLLLSDGQVSEAEEPFPLFIYQPTTGLPGKQLNLNQGEMIQSVPQPSPDGSVFYYLEYNKGQPARTLVVQSVDGHMRKVILERKYPFGYPTWIDSRSILWSDVLNPEDYWVFGERADRRNFIPTNLIDVKTLKVQNLPPIKFPQKDGEYIVQGFIHKKTEDFAFLQHNWEQVSFEIYSYATQTSQPVFTWLPANFLMDPRDTSTFITSNGKVNFIASNGNVIWLVSQVDVEQVLSGQDALAYHVFEIIYPEEVTPSFIPYYFKTRNAFLYIHSTKSPEDPLEAAPEYLFRFDIETQTIYNYCLDIQKSRTIMYISPDEEFAAMTFYQDPLTLTGKKDTILINLTTGAKAILPDYQVFGWVSVNN